MTESDALAVYANATELWRFVGKWSPAQVKVFTDGLRRIPIDLVQARACLEQLAREVEKTPPLAMIVKRLKALVPTRDRGVSPRQQPKERGRGMPWDEYVRGVAEGVLEGPDRDSAGLMDHAISTMRLTGKVPSLSACMAACGVGPKPTEPPRRIPCQSSASSSPPASSPPSRSSSSPAPSSSPSASSGPSSHDEFEAEIDREIGRNEDFFEARKPIPKSLLADDREDDDVEW